MSGLGISLDGLPDIVQELQLAVRFEEEDQHDLTIHPPSSHRHPTLEKWTWKRILGQGDRSEVILQERITAQADQPKLRVVKSIRLPDDPNESSAHVYQHIELVSKFSQPEYAGQFATCLGWYTGIGTVHIATEYCELGDLDRYLPKLGGRLFETDIYDVTWQILSALRSLHEQGFSHGGLKLSNVLVMTTHPSWWVKLADFGLSKLNESLTGMITARGILHEIAPEVLGYSGNPSNVDPFLVDMWSLGQIAFRISAGHPMFSSHESLFSYCDGQTPIRESVLQRHAVEENFIQFIKGLAEPRPGLRLSLRDALGFSWTRVYQPYQTQPILSQPQSITPKAQQAQQVVTNTPPVVSKPVVPQLQPVVTKTPPVASRPIVPQLQPVVPQVQPVVSQLNTPRSALPSPAVASNHFENIEIPYARSVEDNNASISSHGDAVDKPLPMKPIITSPSDLLLPHYDQSRSPKSPASFQKSPKSPKNHDEEHEDETNKTGKRNWKYFAKIANGLTQSTTSSTSGSEEQTHTNQSSRKGGSLPNSPSLKSPPRVPSGWVTHLDEPTQQWYFVNRFTNNSQWEVPTSAAKPVKLKESPRPDTPASSKTRKSSKAPNARIARFEENYPSWAI
ncbi:unnamed protein product [Clonostachys rosea f. rosea IK726]|uniref:Protein kinase domain-containing protein n=2 Tax=Bionectria ochroleuca TaxID=29856 RepID=A0A0B7KH45_BIOOC|nr:unnamed protein product [Clonostachys rosea f. rosea IK726]